MSKTIKVSLKDKAKSYEGQDLSLQVFLRGSLVLDIKIGRDWNAPDSYDIPYEGGECRVNVGRSVRNGLLESKLISLDDPQFTGNYVDVLMSDSSIEPVDDRGSDNIILRSVKPDTEGDIDDLNKDVDLTYYNLSDDTPCVPYVSDDSEDCCDDSEGCCGDKDKPF